jgi:hypothetical protein
MRQQRLLLFAVLSLATVATCYDGRPTSLSEARAAIEANTKTAAGKAYEERIGKEFVEKYTGTIRQCKQAAGKDWESYWTLMKLAADGKVQEVLLYPENKVGMCERQTLIKDRFSVPPRDSYWVGIYLKLK